MEQVLVVKAEHLAPCLTSRGLIRGREEEILEIIQKHIEFMPRDQAEEDPGYKQIIPYVVIRRGPEIFMLKRRDKGGEKRLHGLVSLGVGGHINPDADGTDGDALHRGMLRELTEEVSATDVSDPVLCGVINDDTNSVGSVHLGLMYIMDIRGDVRVRERDKLDGRWVKKASLPEYYDQMETWSQIILEAL